MNETTGKIVALVVIALASLSLGFLTGMGYRAEFGKEENVKVGDTSWCNSSDFYNTDSNQPIQFGFGANGRVTWRTRPVKQK